MGSFFGVFIGDLFAHYKNYRQFHEIYDATNSAPWYYGAISSLILFIAVVIVCVIIKLIIRNKTKQQIRYQFVLILSFRYLFLIKDWNNANRGEAGEKENRKKAWKRKKSRHSDDSPLL